MIHEHIVGATFDRSNMSQSKISQEGSIGRDRQRLIDRAGFNSPCYTLPRLSHWITILLVFWGESSNQEMPSLVLSHCMIIPVTLPWAPCTASQKRSHCSHEYQYNCCVSIWRSIQFEYISSHSSIHRWVFHSLRSTHNNVFVNIPKWWLLILLPHLHLQRSIPPSAACLIHTKEIT